MELKKDGFLHKVAYGYWVERKPPETTTLCRLFWRLMWAAFVVWPVVICFSIIAIPVYYVVATPIALIGGYKPILFSNNESDNLFFERASWHAKAAKVWHGIGVGIGICCIIGALFLVGFLIYETIPTSWFLSNSGFSVLGAIVLLIATLIFRKSEAWKVIKAFVKAKKEKVCPIIEFK